MTKKKSIFKDTFYYTAANYLAQTIGIVNSIVLRRFMGPASLGIWSFLQVILNYCGYASFGTTKAMARDYPYLRGKGEIDKAERLKNLTLNFSMLMSIIPAIAIFIYVYLKWNQTQAALRVGLIFIGFFLFIQRFYDFFINLLRSEKKFDILGQLIALNALGGLIITLTFVARWNIYGQYAGMAILTSSCLAFIWLRGKFGFQFYWNSKELMKELKLGIPLVIVTFMIEFLKSMDKLIIAKQLGFYNMGLYSMAMMANSYVFSLPMMFSHVWYPNLQEEFGRKQNAEGIKHYLLKPTLTLAILCPFFCGLAFFIIPYITYLFLPKFIPGLWPMKIYLVGTFFLLLAQFSGNFLVTLDKYFINIPVLAIAMVVNFVCNITLIRMGRGLEGVAIGTAMSFAVYGFTTYMIAMKEFASWNEVFSNLLKLSVCLILFFGGIFLIDHYLQNQNPLKDSFVKTIVFLVFSAPFFLVLEKKTGLFKSTLKSL